MKRMKLFIGLGVLLWMLFSVTADCLHQGRHSYWHKICNTTAQRCGPVFGYNCIEIGRAACVGKDGNLYYVDILQVTLCPIPTAAKNKLKLEVPKGWKYIKRSVEKKEKKEEKK